MQVIDHFLTKEVFEIKPTDLEGVYKTHPIPKNLDKYYESKDYISHHQDANTLKEKIYKFLQKFNLNYKYNIIAKRIPKGGTVLDYGCGAGEFLKHLEQDFTTLGLEPNEKARNAATKKTTKTQFFSSLEEVKDNSIDAITLWHVLEHIENRDEIIEQLLKKLKNEGQLIIALPNPESYDAKKYKACWAAYDVPRHIWHFTKKGIDNICKKHNVQLEEIKPLILDAFYISILSEKYKKNPLFFIFGGFFGAISNFKASKTGEFSSLIYLIKK